jgi:SRSO17 transposase
MEHEVAAAAIVEVTAAEQNRTELLLRLGVHFTRVEPRAQAGKYIRALGSDVPRKNCWALAEHAGDATPDRMQRLLDRAVWDTLAAMGTVRDFVAEHLADPGLCVLVVDESGVPKSGTRTCAVKRQYIGVTGKVDNAVNLVNATFSTPRGHALIATRLYVPAEHLTDPARCTLMGLPDKHAFATKPQLATDMILEALAADVPAAWCTADAVYGRDRALREACEQHSIGYSLGVPCSFRIALASGEQLRVDTVTDRLPTESWQISSCGPGSKGDRFYAWAWVATTSTRHFLLVRRSLTKATDRAYFYCFVPEQTPATLTNLVAVTGRRWTIEEDHQFGKDQFGYDQFQARRYTPILRHLVLVMAALAICAVTVAHSRARTGPPPTPATTHERAPADLAVIAITVAELKRLINLYAPVRHPVEHHLHWSWWRRHHQAHARWHHHRARLR